MRALLDTNVLISYLLDNTRQSPTNRIVRSAFRGEFVLLVPEELLSELVRKARGKRYLTQRITGAELQEFCTLLSEITEEIPQITEEIPAVTRDLKDDYLLAYALVGEADFLVTGDEDLLSLGDIEGLRIVTPREFARVLDGI